jgi:hypothetical protein
MRDPDNDDGDDAFVQKFLARSVPLLRDLLAEQRATQRRTPAKRRVHVAAAIDLEPVDEVTRARAHTLLAKQMRGR